MSAAAGFGSVAGRLAVGPMALIGRAILTQLTLLGAWVELTRRSVRYLLVRRLEVPLFIRQIDQIGIGSIPMAALTVTFSSMVLALYTTAQFIEFGFQEYLGYLIGASVVRELGPVLTAIVVASRQGAAIAAELASMKVTEQIDALRSLATDPVEYLVVPRFAAALAAVPLLTVLASVAGITGGWLVAASFEIPREVFWGAVQRGVEAGHVLTGVIKALCFGAIISIVSCHQGLSAGYGAESVGRATTASVVLCVLLVHVADFCLALVFGG